MVLNRSKNTFSGTIFGLVLKATQILFPFFIRTFFIYTIGIEYLGLNGLFSSVLQLLNLAELGVSSALIFSMYKPIANNDEDKICALIKLYKNYYRIIGFIVLMIGIMLMPFLSFFVSGDVPPDINIRVIYLMSLCSTVISYFCVLHLSLSSIADRSS